MQVVYFIHPTVIKANTSVNSNINDKYLMAAIQEVQDTKVRNLLGNQLFDKVSNLILNDTIKKTGNEVYYNLLLLLRQFIVYSVLVKVNLNVFARATNGGVVKNNDDTFSSVSLEELKYLNSQYSNVINTYYRLIQEYLIEHWTEIPEVLKFKNYKSILTKLQGENASGLWLGGSRGKHVKTTMDDLIWGEHRWYSRL